MPLRASPLDLEGQVLLSQLGCCDQTGDSDLPVRKRFEPLGKLVRESTKQANDKVARNMESAHRTSLGKGEVGIREKALAPTLTEFLKKDVLPYTDETFNLFWSSTSRQARFR